MKITVKKLKALGACKDQVKLFQDLFGPSVVVTEALCIQHAQEFSWGWAAQNFLSAPALKAYDKAIASARKAYAKAIAPASKAYQEATASAWKTYQEATASAWKTYTKAAAPALKAYREARAPTWEAYREAAARAFGRLAEQEE